MSTLDTSTLDSGTLNDSSDSTAASFGDGSFGSGTFGDPTEVFLSAGSGGSSHASASIALTVGATGAVAAGVAQLVAQPAQLDVGFAADLHSQSYAIVGMSRPLTVRVPTPIQLTVDVTKAMSSAGKVGTWTKDWVNA